MKIKIIYLLIITTFLFQGCYTEGKRGNNKHIITYNLDLYINNKLEKSNVGTIKYSKGDTEIAVTFMDTLHSRFNQKEMHNGLYRKIKDEYVLSHSFTKKREDIFFPEVKPPFLNQITRLLADTTLHIEGKDQRVYIYDEYVSSHVGYITYYLADKGFIGFYGGWSDDNKIIVSHTTEKEVDDTVLKELIKFMNKDHRSRIAEYPPPPPKDSFES